MTKLFKESLIERLKDQEYAQAYIAVALEEFEADRNMEAFLMALRAVASAQGGLTELSKRTHLNRQNLYKQLSRTGNPSFKTVDNVLNGLGFKLTVQTAKNHLSL